MVRSAHARDVDWRAPHAILQLERTVSSILQKPLNEFVVTLPTSSEMVSEMSEMVSEVVCVVTLSSSEMDRRRTFDMSDVHHKIRTGKVQAANHLNRFVDELPLQVAGCVLMVNIDSGRW